MKKEKLFWIGWSLSTSEEDIIAANAEEEGFDLSDNNVKIPFWDEVNDSIRDFESEYENILKPFVKSCECHGHDSDDSLVGSAMVTKKQLKKIQEFESGGEGEHWISSTKGDFNCDELDILHSCVDATLVFYLNDIEEV